MNAHPSPLLVAKNLAWPAPCAPQSFTLWPGLTLVLGDEQRGKSNLLRVMAGQQAPLSGELNRPTGQSCFVADTLATALDALPAQDWLQQQSQCFAQWQTETADALAQAFGLSEHLPKPFYMHSAGSRRKVGIVAAAACGADLVLLDTPYAALDLRSCRLLDEVLADAADSQTQAWVVADYARPQGLSEVALAGVIDLDA